MAIENSDISESELEEDLEALFNNIKEDDNDDVHKNF